MGWSNTRWSSATSTLAGSFRLARRGPNPSESMGRLRLSCLHDLRVRRALGQAQARSWHGLLTYGVTLPSRQEQLLDWTEKYDLCYTHGFGSYTEGQA